MSRNKIAFAIIGALLCLFMLSFFIYSTFSDKPKVLSNKSNKVITAAASVKVSQADQLLHNGFSKLQQMDQAYAVRLLDPNSSSMLLDSMNNNIIAMEQALKESIDSIEVSKDNVGNEKSQSAEYYRKVLEDRSNIHSTKVLAKQKEVTTSPNKTDNAALQSLQLELLKKEDRIKILENQLQLVAANLQSSNKRPVVADDLPSVSNKPYSDEGLLLTDKLQKKEIAFNGLQEKYYSLEQEKNNLQKKLNEPRNPAVAAPSEQRVTELEAALRLAEVECNLTRADGGQIISNSKQRKALLEQSLKILNALTSSSSADVQKQARAKMTELKNIAAMIRD